MGFWQVYAATIVVVDAREQNAEKQKAGSVTFCHLKYGAKWNPPFPPQSSSLMRVSGSQ